MERLTVTEMIDAIKSNYPHSGYTMLREALDHALELMDAEKEGRMIVLPCKVGDTVYVLPRSWEDKEICDWEITNLTITQNKKLEWTKKYRAMKLFNGKTIDCGIDFRFDEIGKTVFLAREEAEAALAAREEREDG